MSGPLEALVGTWAGSGRGFYPTITAFGYTEEVTFTAVAGKPFLAYTQRTRHATEDRPLHAESGYWRWVDEDRRLEVVMAHPTGIAEILEGDLLVVDGGLDLVLESSSIALTATAKEVRATRRRFELRGDELRYSVAMAAVGQPLQEHLEAELHRR
ncbi:MAG: FABP family protein [Acidimicrobiales bacterium]